MPTQTITEEENAVGEDIFVENFILRSVDVSIQVGHANTKGITNTAKSCYYRSAIILACTMVEGLLYKFVEINIGNHGGSLGKRKVNKYPHNIPATHTHPDKKLTLCIQEEEEVKLTKHTTFEDLIIFCKQNNLITTDEAKLLDRVRKLRNKIHLQSLLEKDRGYTKRKLEEVMGAMLLLTKKLKGNR